jgi:hypothetical protein
MKDKVNAGKFTHTFCSQLIYPWRAQCKQQHNVAYTLPLHAAAAAAVAAAVVSSLILQGNAQQAIQGERQQAHTHASRVNSDTPGEPSESSLTTLHTPCPYKLLLLLWCHRLSCRAMHNKPYKVNASKLTRVLPGFTYIPLEDSVRAAADSVVAMGLAAVNPMAVTCCAAPMVRGEEDSEVIAAAAAAEGQQQFAVVAEIAPKISADSLEKVSLSGKQQQQQQLMAQQLR